MIEMISKNALNNQSNRQWSIEDGNRVKNFSSLLSLSIGLIYISNFKSCFIALNLLKISET